MKRMNCYRVDNFFILRTPSQSVEDLIRLNEEIIKGDEVTLKESIEMIFSQAALQEAIYLASPSLHNELIKWLNHKNLSAKRQDKLVLSLYKYFIRMSTRCTPYGLFAGCEVGSIGGKPTVVTLADQSYKYARLDMNVLAEIIERLLTDPIIQEQVKFYPNNSLYPTDNAYRYVAYTLKNKRRSYRLSSVKKNIYLDQILALAEGGKTVMKLAEQLLALEDDFSTEEAVDYIQQMIRLQLLTSELMPAITGEEGLPTLIGQLKQKQGTESYVEALEGVTHLLTNQEPTIDKYAHIKSSINQKLVKISGRDLIQADLYFRDNSSNIHHKCIDNLVSDSEALLCLVERRGNARLESFRKRFVTRFGEQEVPLAIALDSELGVGYGLHVNGISDHMPLLECVRVPEKPEDPVINWSKLTQLKMRKMTEALAKNEHEVFITDSDLEGLRDESVPPQELLDSMYLFGTFLANSAEDIDDGHCQFQFKALSGPSAAKLMGRFCAGSPSLTTKLQALLKEEREAHPEKIYAEIVHLPQARTGNILFRPTIGQYEIPYLGRASVDEEHQIPLNDLTVRYQQNKIVLWSKRLNKEIVPRLTTAHNFSRGLPVYKFLCDLQFQDKVSSVFWQWEPFNKEPFLPRINYKNIIVSRARWYLSTAEYGTLMKEAPNLLITFNVRSTLNMPRYVALATGDNELMLDLECSLSLKILKEKLVKSNVLLYEFLQSPDACPVLGKRGKQTHEMIIPLKKAKYSKDTYSMSAKTKPESVVQRTFSIGSEWLYVKIYAGNKTIDRILTEVIKPLTSQLVKSHSIERWFFIRYVDPEPHLRIRFQHQGDRDFWKFVLEQLYDQLNAYLQEGIVHKIQTDTYQREIERYGQATTILSEKLFFYDSEAVINFLSLLKGVEGERYRWLFALRGIDELLHDFGYTTVQKGKLMSHLHYNFFQEHYGDKQLKRSLDNKYRADRSAISDILNPAKDSNYILPAVDCFRERSSRSQQTVAYLKEVCRKEGDTSIAYLMPSYIHMFLNRLLLSKPRSHELILYHYLMKHYHSQVAQSENSATVCHREALEI